LNTVAAPWRPCALLSSSAGFFGLGLLGHRRAPRIVFRRASACSFSSDITSLLESFPVFLMGDGQQFLHAQAYWPFMAIAAIHHRHAVDLAETVRVCSGMTSPTCMLRIGVDRAVPSEATIDFGDLDLLRHQADPALVHFQRLALQAGQRSRIGSIIEYGMQMWISPTPAQFHGEGGRHHHLVGRGDVGELRIHFRADVLELDRVDRSHDLV
jgi:hypothetical protein